MTDRKRGRRPGSTDAATPRAPRADAVANRARIVAAAHAAFTELGFEVPLDDIAARAGVGPGTVHRHFPTKAELVDAVLALAVTELVDEARSLAGADDPGAAFWTFLEHLVSAGAAAHELAHRLGPAAGDVEAAVATPTADLRRWLARLRSRAQQAGAVRSDLDDDGLAAVIAAGHAAYTHPGGGDRALGVVLDGLRPAGARRPIG
ncbi:MAG TPA: TetR/AcrR family transcriptional regulator [Microlunatus sp.]|nr:TetR/AcrR family transcriptional regulator [Microlunatus sp.]